MNLPFRKIDPVRSTPTTLRSNYRHYKPDLKSDFNSRCGYCDALDMWKETFYEVDHFVPVVILKTIAKNDYKNLVYSCRSCNNSKRKHWIGSNEKIHNNGKEGFIDPCDKKYAKLFHRNQDGAIKYKVGNSLAEWMYKKLKLFKKDHALIWKVTSIYLRLTDIDNIPNLSPLQIDEKNKLNDLFRKYLTLLIQTRI